jgi:hypothetical protein
MKYRPAECCGRTWVRWLYWFLPQFILSGASVLAGEVKAFTLAGLKLLPTPWDRAANFAKLESTPAKLPLPELISLSRRKAILRGTSVTTR